MLSRATPGMSARSHPRILHALGRSPSPRGGGAAGLKRRFESEVMGVMASGPGLLTTAIAPGKQTPGSSRRARHSPARLSHLHQPPLGRPLVAIHHFPEPLDHVVADREDHETPLTDHPRRLGEGFRWSGSPDESTKAHHRGVVVVWEVRGLPKAIRRGSANGLD